MIEITALLSKLISFKSLTPNDDGALAYIASLLPEFEAIFLERNGVKNLILTKKFSDDGKHLAFAGHIDVVPAGGGWHSDPFVATICDGTLYGRGTSDMKSGVAAMICAAKNAKNLFGRLSLLLTSDEEGDAVDGTVVMLEYLKEKNLLPYCCIVAEPTCEDLFGDTIKVGRRGSINGVLSIFGRGGHAAYPQKAVNPINQAGDLIHKIANAKLDNGDEFFAPSLLVITDIKGGYNKHNVIPSEVSLLFNVRNSTKTGVQEVENFVIDALKSCKIEKYELRITQSSNAFVIKENEESKKVFESLQRNIFAVCGVKAKPSTAGGTSDARFVSLFGVGVLEFGVKNETIHAPNECVDIEDLKHLELIFTTFTKEFLAV